MHHQAEKKENNFKTIFFNMMNNAIEKICTDCLVKYHSESQRKLEAKYTVKIKSLKSNIKTLKRKVTLVQKALFYDRVKILSLEVKVPKLKELLLKKNNEIDTLLPSINNSSQPSALNPSSQIISVGGAEVVSLPATAPIIELKLAGIIA
ncbi:hypothetical protein C1645_830049 [Glomus cerebriforme]|uniref:Uncharacterized protein n=1 Tax=Glomus cerebriforme TaxID=658196 RepID=A0A397SIS2_9GLOM|nr:hypothetical protein C1645_830049 [Glomus cerebriforme]